MTLSVSRVGTGPHGRDLRAALPSRGSCWAREASLNSPGDGVRTSLGIFL